MILLALAFFLFPSLVFSQSLPDWYIPLREAVYEQQLSADAVAPIYRDITNRARTSLAGYDQYLILSRCEFMMGKAYLNEERKNEASAHFEEGMKSAEESLKIRETADAWVMLAENLSQNIASRSSNVFYAMANGLNVEKYSKNALSFNSRNAAAQYMIAARWVFAPAPFNNIRKGIEMMSAIIDSADMGKDDTFNVYSALGYAYIQQRNNTQARIWLNRSLEIYPTNKYALSMLSGLN